MRKFLKKLNKKTIIPAGLILLAIIAFFSFKSGGQTENLEIQNAKQVDLLDISASSASRSKVVASGKIEAAQEAILVSEASGVIKSVNVSIGDSVGRGQILVSLSNADAAAAVAGAKATLATAETGVSSSGVSLENSRIDVIDAIQSSLTRASDILNVQISSLYKDPEIPEGFGVSITSGGVSYTVEASSRIQNDKINTLTSDSVKAIANLRMITEEGIEENETILAATEAEETLLLVRDLLNQIASVLSGYKITNSAEQSFYGGFKTTVSSSQTSINASLSSLRSSMQSYNSSLTSDNGASTAGARAALEAAEAQYAKTFVRAPFSGRVLSVEARTGEYISTGARVASILDSSSKKVTIYLSSNDALNVSVGAKALVNGIFEGVVAEKAPGIDSKTGKVEATIYLSGNEEGIVTGEYADVAISSSEGGASDPVMLPLRAVKMNGSTPSVMIVSEGVIKAIPITVGSIQGDRIEVTSGLESIDFVIENTRGLSAGDSAVVRESL
jgi:multidrug efflux pump subunit AcrA (membrane-fusion protein)